MNLRHSEYRGTKERFWYEMKASASRMPDQRWRLTVGLLSEDGFRIRAYHPTKRACWKHIETIYSCSHTHSRTTYELTDGVRVGSKNICELCDWELDASRVVYAKYFKEEVRR